MKGIFLKLGDETKAREYQEYIRRAHQGAEVEMSNGGSKYKIAVVYPGDLPEETRQLMIQGIASAAEDVLPGVEIGIIE